MKAYKLVCVETENKKTRYFSYMAEGSRDLWNPRYVEYFLNHDTFPEEDCGPLAVFDTLDNLIVFYKKYVLSAIMYKIFECDFDPYIPEPEKGCALWYRLSDEDFMMNLSILPQGTLLASRVRLLKEIKGDPR